MTEVIVDPARRPKVLRGCKAIAGYTREDEREWRAIHHLCSTGRFPHFREGSTICARPDVIDRWMEAQELAALQGRRLSADELAAIVSSAEKVTPGTVR